MTLRYFIGPEMMILLTELTARNVINLKKKPVCFNFNLSMVGVEQLDHQQTEE